MHDAEAQVTVDGAGCCSNLREDPSLDSYRCAGDIKWMAATRLTDQWTTVSRAKFSHSDSSRSSPASSIALGVQWLTREKEHRRPCTSTSKYADGTVTAVPATRHRTFGNILSCVTTLRSTDHRSSSTRRPSHARLRGSI